MHVTKLDTRKKSNAHDATAPKAASPWDHSILILHWIFALSVVRGLADNSRVLLRLPFAFAFDFGRELPAEPVPAPVVKAVCAMSASSKNPTLTGKK